MSLELNKSYKGPYEQLDVLASDVTLWRSENCFMYVYMYVYIHHIVRAYTDIYVPLGVCAELYASAQQYVHL